MTIYKLFWDDFCAWYLEAVKPAFGAGIDKETYNATIGFFDALLKMIHPVMPFITEELWQNMAVRSEGETIMNQRYPAAGEYRAELISDFAMACEAVAGVRNIRQQKNISPKEQLELRIKGEFPSGVLPVVVKLANISSVGQAEGDMSAAQRFMVSTAELFVPLDGLVDLGEELRKLEADLDYYRNFLASVRRKLSNERFTANAPEAVVAVERKKESDSLAKIESIENAINSLKNSK
ncbi:MAG: class I tRNA ligase family protein, partial [Bacteroidales bacterium]|nr:class I tRNA ligase family protein [Bacteroidales bacterium]